MGMAKLIHFPRWSEVLSTSALSPSDRRAYKISIRWYLSWCGHRSVGCSAESAREFVEWAQREKNAKEWTVARWKEALRWFFVTAKAQREGNPVEEGSLGFTDGLPAARGGIRRCALARWPTPRRSGSKRDRRTSGISFQRCDAVEWP